MPTGDEVEVKRSPPVLNPPTLWPQSPLSTSWASAGDGGPSWTSLTLGTWKGYESAGAEAVEASPTLDC